MNKLTQETIDAIKAQTKYINISTQGIENAMFYDKDQRDVLFLGLNKKTGRYEIRFHKFNEARILTNLDMSITEDSDIVKQIQSIIDVDFKTVWGELV